MKTFSFTVSSDSDSVSSFIIHLSSFVMDTRITISPDQLLLRPVNDFNQKWFLLTAGDFSKKSYNAMTISWGSLGVLWNKPIVQVFVRPQRYTREFIDAFPTFTLTLFRNAYRPALQLLGTKSGRDGDKIAESGLTPEPSSRVAAPSFAEAELIIEARKLFSQKMEASAFHDPSLIPANYAGNDFHTLYFGEILAVRATAAYYTATN